MPLSTMSPSRRTRMRSAFLMVDRRWAMTKEVRCSMSWSMAAWIFCSVRVSTEEVASSRMSMGLSAIMARAMVSCCFCPWERLTWSLRIVSYPLGRVRMKWCRPTALQAFSMVSSLTPGVQ